MKIAKTIKKENIFSLLDTLAEKYQLFAPVEKDGIINFAEVSGTDQIALEFYNTKESPKKFFFPQSETLYSYSKDKGRNVPQRSAEKQRVLFGIRPCDAEAITILDEVFDSPDFKDPYFITKRKNTTIFSFACNKPQISCFCASLNSGPFSEAGSDVLIIDLPEKYLFQAITDKGKKLLEELQDLKPAEKSDTEQVEKLKTAAQNKIKKQIQTDGLTEKLDDIFDHHVWDKIHEKCIGCGICTYLCPTCHCFYMVDEAHNNEGRRVRNWDSCMFPTFTLEASGHNPRPTGKQRMRQRIMHKFNHFVKNFGRFACTGCGRCTRNCPVSMDLTKIVEEIKNTR